MTKDEALKKAFKQAFQLGQDYWHQADHEYVSQNKKSDVTRAKFEQLLEDAIKEALAQPEQPKVRTGNCLRVGVCASEGHKIAPQRTWVGLTDEEMMQIYIDLKSVAGFYSVEKYARAIEAKLKEKQ